MKIRSVWLILAVAAAPLVGGCNDSQQQKANELGSNVWGEAGSLAYAESATTMQNRSPAGQALAYADRQALRTLYGDTVDRILVHWGSTPLNELAAQQFSIPVVGVDAEAQTFGYDVYVRDQESTMPDRSRLSTLIHELRHTRQFEQLGSDLKSFGYAYFKAYAEAGYDYDTNAMEVDAENAAQTSIDSVLKEYQRLTAQNSAK